jgi:caspase domain-containing protein
MTRDIGVDGDKARSCSRAGRNLIAVIGIDRYRHPHWSPLTNAVNDARGALALFEQLGFEQAAPMLIDDGATGRAIQSLVADDLVTIGPDDSLVLFYSGHGGNRKHRVGDRELTTGYLIPVDAEDRVATWVDLEAWLRFVALLPAKHILVILDACHSGIALDPIIKWRDSRSHHEPLSTLSTWTSRRIITSARSGQRAMDGGPHPGHSLFTGCLIEALTHGLRRNGELVTTGSELGLHVRQRVGSYPQSQQTPDFGTFAFDQRGEMVLSSMLEPREPRGEAPFAALTTSTWMDTDDPDDDLDDGVELPTSGTGSSAIDSDDRTTFWTSVEQLLAPPTTIRGAWTRRYQAFRHGAFAGNVRLGVVANANGAMRVHLWSLHRDHQETLRDIERAVLDGSIAVPTQLGPLKTRLAPKGEQLYLEFAWHRSGGYLRELDRVKASIDWFVGTAKSRFR